MYRKYYSMNDMPVLANPKKADTAVKCEKSSKEQQISKNQNPILNVFSNLEIDDIILLVIIFMLVMEDCDDLLLLLALGIIFFT